MFLASHNAERREAKIRAFLYREPSIAVLLAAANFEWTVCRAILFLSENVNRELRKSISSVHRFDGYKDLWHQEVCSLTGGKRLTEVVQDWAGLKNGFSLRNKLIHGQDRATRNMATPRVDAMLRAVRDIDGYCRSMGYDLGKRMPVRKSTMKKRLP
jgi:hypothetical protein